VGFPTPEPRRSSADLRSRSLYPEREETENEEKGRMASIVAKTGIRREKGWLYFLDKRGDVSRARMARGGGRAVRGQQKVARCGVKREDGWLYYIDKQGNVCKVKMKRSAGGRRRAPRRTAARRAPRRRTARRTVRRASARRTTRRRARR
jgi:hypothetical protein